MSAIRGVVLFAAVFTLWTASCAADEPLPEGLPDPIPADPEAVSGASTSLSTAPSVDRARCPGQAEGLRVGGGALALEAHPPTPEVLRMNPYADFWTDQPGEPNVEDLTACWYVDATVSGGLIHDEPGPVPAIVYYRGDQLIGAHTIGFWEAEIFQTSLRLQAGISAIYDHTGQPLKNFESEAERLGLVVRVLRMDGEGLDYTDDVRANRVNVSVTDGMVIEILGIF